MSDIRISASQDTVRDAVGFSINLEVCFQQVSYEVWGSSLHKPQGLTELGL